MTRSLLFDANLKLKSFRQLSLRRNQRSNVLAIAARIVLPSELLPYWRALGEHTPMSVASQIQEGAARLRRWCFSEGGGHRHRVNAIASSSQSRAQLKG